jgi:hypothetical protein
VRRELRAGRELRRGRLERFLRQGLRGLRLRVGGRQLRLQRRERVVGDRLLVGRRQEPAFDLRAVRLADDGQGRDQVGGRRQPVNAPNSMTAWCGATPLPSSTRSTAALPMRTRPSRKARASLSFPPS